MEPGPFDNYITLFRIAWFTWWFWLPPLLFYSAWELWKAYLKIWYWKTLEWTILEVKIPREITKPPQAMEQVFAGIHGIGRPFDPDEKYWYGLQDDYVVFEMISHEGEIHFLIHTPKKFRNLVEAQIYAQYPESEIREAEDPTGYLPRDVPNAEWSLFGAEWKFSKPDPYPIRTYHEFVLEEGTKEEIKVDPVSAVAEMLSKIKDGEHAGLQLMIRPILESEAEWKEEGEKIIRKLIGKKAPSKAATEIEKIAADVYEVAHKVVVGPLPLKEEQREAPESLMLHLSPGEKDVVTSVGKKISKLGFEAALRFVYVAKRDRFDMVHFSSVMGAMRQFNTQDLNSFKLNSRALVGAKWYSWIKQRTKEKKRKAFYYYYRTRQPFSSIYLMHSVPIVLNIEELASIFHFPGRTAAAPLMPRLQARRAEPPPGLPVG
ncbi:MAG: hypothetical protein HYW90_00065 [Candidatus Sungbacteria bacterium]|nr:hypothetical protein [Candidatus Sungbacteria bacterium]